MYSVFVIIHTTHGASIDSPVFGYHMRIGVPQATRIATLESMRIVGGSAVNAATAIPHQVGIVARLTTGHQSVCGGSLISTTRVLTAAHCWFDGEVQARQFTIVLGSLTIFTGGTRIDTTAVTMHPSWNYLRNDLAMVRISAVKLSNTIQVIPLPTTADVNQNFAGSTGVISGFGKTSDVHFHQRFAMLRCCGCVWLPQIIFIGTHSLALVETDSAKLCFYMKRCVLRMCTMYGFATVDTSHTCAAHLPRTITLRRHVFIINTLLKLNSIAKM
ncbi:hypothetical protein SFRURICE_018100 [Spodoptera frugiperda]|nr:hypothetical protein SFRURICE_018100 [Spodoptera frugiperda]